MSVVIFVREDLLKATHKELKWIQAYTDKHGRVHGMHQKHVLVADDHDNAKVATGQGSFYQKIAHKNAMADIPNFQSLDIDHQANIILHHATGLQVAASASAAVSQFKASMLAGKVPLPAQYLAMQNAPANMQGKVVDACVAAIGAEKYEQLLLAASAKANNPKGKTSEPKTPQAVKTSPQGLAQGAAGAPAVAAAEPAKVAEPVPPVKAAVTDDLPPKVKAKLDDWATDGYVDRLQDVMDDHGSSPAYQAYAKKLLEQFEPPAAAHEPFFGPTVNTPVPANFKALIDGMALTPDVGSAKLMLGNIVAVNGHNPHIQAYASAKLAELNKPDDSVTVPPVSGKTGPTTFKPAPDFADYAEAQAWILARAKALGMSKSEFQSSHEFSHAYPKIHAAYAVVKKQFDDKKAGIGAAMVAEMDAAGVKLGDTVAFTMTGAFLSSSHYEGKVVMHGGIPHVKLAYEVSVNKPGGKIGYTKYLVWAPYMKVKGAPAAVEPAKAAGSDDGPKEGDTKTENGKTYKLYDGKWHRTNAEGWTFTAHSFGAHAHAAGIKVPASDPDFVAVYGLDGSSSKTIQAMNEWHKGWEKADDLADAQAKPSTGPGNSANAVAADTSSAGKKATSTTLSAAQLAAVQDIPWFKLKLPESNTNAKTHNAAIAKIEAMAHAGDVAGLQAFADAKANAKQTYAKKQGQVAQAVINALAGAAPAKVFVTTPPPVAASPAAAPVNEAKLKFTGNPDVYDFIVSFEINGKPSQAEMAAFNKLTPVEKSDVAAAISFYGPHKHQLFMTWLGEQNAKAAAPASSAGPVPVTSMVFTNTTPGHKKFWSVSTHGKVMKTTYGKLGTQGSTTTKEFASIAAAVLAATKLENEKKAKGYKYGYTGVHQYDGAAAADPVSAPAKPTLAQAVADSGSLSGATAVIKDHIALAGETEQAFDEAHAAALSQGYTSLAQAINTKKEAKFPESQDAVAPVAAGPKDGDTKQGADGTLVFKDGHWHKQVTMKFTKDAVKKLLLDKTGQKFPTNLAVTATFIAAKAGSASGIVAAHALAVSNGWSNTAKKIVIVARAMGVSIDDSSVAPSASPKAVFTTDPAAIAAAKQGAAAPAPKAKPTMSAPMVKTVAGKPPVTVIDGWAQTGQQKGSNPGGKFKDKAGQEWYCKFPADVDVAMNELLAAKFYQMLGVAVPTLKLVEQGGKVGIASKWVDGISKGTSAQLAKAPGAHQAFALDAWLANWDVVGLSNDNLMLGKDGAAVRVDVGGSLVYRAQGGAKGDAFGDTVPELETLLNAKLNDKSAAVFGGIKKADMDWGLGQLNKMKPSQIEEMCQKVGPGSDADKAALAKKLIARRAYILAKMGVRDQWASVKALDPTKLPVSQADLPKPIQFKASSHAHINAQNTKDSEALIAFASNGNLTALKDYTYDAVDKDTGAPLGKTSILDHPSKPLKEQWAGLVELLQSISAPPMPTLELPSLGSIGDLEDISAFVGTFSPQERVETVASEHRMHFFMALSHIDDISDLVSGMKWSFLKSAGKFVQDAKAKHSSLSSQVKGYISAVQSSGSINHSWSQGKTTVSTGGSSVGIHGLTAKIYAEAQELPEGTTLIRGMSDTSSGKSMCNQLLACAPGTVIQNTDSMCASYNESHSWGGDVQMTIRCAKGCKATLSFATGKYGGEHEITTLPGQRYVVLSTKKVNDTVHLEVLMLPPHEGFVSELANLASLGKAMSVIFVRGR